MVVWRYHRVARMEESEKAAEAKRRGEGGRQSVGKNNRK